MADVTAPDTGHLQRYDALVSISKTLASHNTVAELFQVLAHHLHAIVPFDALALICTTARRRKCVSLSSSRPISSRLPRRCYIRWCASSVSALTVPARNSADAAHGRLRPARLDVNGPPGAVAHAVRRRVADDVHGALLNSQVWEQAPDRRHSDASTADGAFLPLLLVMRPACRGDRSRPRYRRCARE
jgi:hypothetical protein